MSKFFVAPAKFESKSIVANNSLIFHRSLSDATKLLILAMHAIMSCTYTWVIVQEDLQNRMGWGKEKMRNAIKEAVQFGYLRVRQGRKTELKDENGNIIKGQFACNEFDFDVTGGLLNVTEENTEKPAHNQSEPETVNPSTAKPCAEKQPLPISLSLPISKKQQQAPVSAVVSLSLEKIDIPKDEKIWLTKTYPEETIRQAVLFATDSKTIIKTTLLQAIKWACLKCAEGNPPQVPVDHVAEALKAKDNTRDLNFEHLQYSEQLAMEYWKMTGNGTAVRVSFQDVELDLDNGNHPIKIKFIEKDFIQQVENEFKRKNKEMPKIQKL